MKAQTMIDNDLNARQALILERLAAGAKSTEEIINAKVSRVSVTASMDKLIAKNLATRRRGKSDRRKIILGITDKGRSLLAE